jgi:hypothetical protein
VVILYCREAIRYPIALGSTGYALANVRPPRLILE